ncbi:MAG: RHS repeat-associated core domain-containing protein, partial [Bacteroidota bacterium]
PRAFVNYIFFDREMNYVRAGFLQITTAAQGVGVHETISLNDIIADRKGYILAYLSNENAEEVAIHWDDFRVYHGKTNVVYATNYYPGGFTFNEHQRTASVKNKWKFQSKEWLPELRVYDFGPRGWDPLIWRTNAQDILADQFPDQSSYSLFRNNPVSFTDPTGMSPVDWVEDRNGNIYWDDNATSQATTKEGETYLGKNVIVGTHNRDATGNEEINTARFDLYLESDKKGSSATIIGNTVPADVTKHGTLAEGLYPARFQGRYSKLKKGIDDLSIIINEGKALPTITGKNPNNPNSDYLTNVFIHAGNKGYERLWYNRKRGDVGYISEGCQTTGCGQGSRRSHNLFMQKVGRDFNGYYFLRSDPNNHKEEN